MGFVLLFLLRCECLHGNVHLLALFFAYRAQFASSSSSAIKLPHGGARLAGLLFLAALFSSLQSNKYD